MSFFSSYWVLPLLFIFHDFEELVLVPYWLLNHDSYIGKKQLFGGVHHSDILAIGIWEEFCIYLLLSTVANLINYPLLVVAATLPYLLHLIAHCIFSIIKHAYVPGVVTSIIEIPITTLYLLALIKLTHIAIWLWFVVPIAVFVAFAANLQFIHIIMSRIEDAMYCRK
ncbi:MAG: HXXEE domain-containing protein [Lactobacillus sp.]|nr:HXXEE domain-containing protein [Lactobacillus sp.]MDN6039826.1 HXXEE domain-containing protein [Lactobacillus sp.]